MDLHANAIVFVSLFLGLVTGRQTIEVAVSEEVAAVQILTDGTLAGELHEEPWRITHDFGPQLTTLRLAAVAFNDAGDEIGRVVQLVNLPRAPVEAEILLEEWIDGSPTIARLLWHSAEALEPLSTSVSLGATLLDASDINRIELPALDPKALHFITAEMMFPGKTLATAEVVFGGAYGSSVESELTAVPLVVKGRRLRSIEATRNWLRHTNGSELPIVAVDNGPAEVAVVREDEAILPLRRIDASMQQPIGMSYWSLVLDRRDRLRFVLTRPSTAVRSTIGQPTIRYQGFPISRAYSPRDGPIPALLARVSFDQDRKPAQRVTDAVAIAGRFVVQTQKRRAVPVLTTDCANVSGGYSPEVVRRYLEELRVPLKVWQMGQVPDAQRGSGFCEAAEEVDTQKKYRAAVRRLRADLDQQQIVWVRGRPLPREITLTSAASGVRLVGD